MSGKVKYLMTVVTVQLTLLYVVVLGTTLV